jgi:hypothetical protein
LRDRHGRDGQCGKRAASHLVVSSVSVYYW